MDYLQYIIATTYGGTEEVSFKPCYKWITFNIYSFMEGLENDKHEF